MNGERPCSGQAAIFSSRVAGENIGPVSPLPIIVVAGTTTPRVQIGHSAFGLNVYERGHNKVPHSRLIRPSTPVSLPLRLTDASSQWRDQSDWMIGPPQLLRDGGPPGDRPEGRGRQAGSQSTTLDP